MSTGTPQVETVSTAADKTKLVVAALLAVGAVAAYYLIKQADWIRWVALVSMLLAAVATFFTAESGKQLLAYGRDRGAKRRRWSGRRARKPFR